MHGRRPESAAGKVLGRAGNRYLPYGFDSQDSDQSNYKLCILLLALIIALDQREPRIAAARSRCYLMGM